MGEKHEGVTDAHQAAGEALASAAKRLKTIEEIAHEIRDWGLRTVAEEASRDVRRALAALGPGKEADRV